jgi:RNA polymerase sigma-70 factor, ECF subfamily
VATVIEGADVVDDQVTGWALAAARGDQAAAAAFVRATQAEVMRFLVHLSSPHEADDLTQETYLRAFRGLRRFAARSSARTWLFSIARRVAADHLRAARSRPRTAAGADWRSAAEAVSAGGQPRIDEQIALRDLLDTLPADQRDAFVATQVLDLSYEEAALVCDCPVGTIRSRVARARAELVAQIRAGTAHRSGRRGA